MKIIILSWNVSRLNDKEKRKVIKALFEIKQSGCSLSAGNKGSRDDKGDCVESRVFLGYYNSIVLA